MYIARGLHNLPQRFKGAVATIGNFDGVHIGHQTLINALVERAGEVNRPALAVTFEPHPQRVISQQEGPKRITSVRGKARLLDALKVDAICILRFSRTLANLPADQFIREILKDGLAVHSVLVGYDFRFGHKGRGDIVMLNEHGGLLGFSASRQPPLLHGDSPVSSTRVRATIQNGDLDEAERLLGRRFEIEGRVKGGERRGRGLGFPTANLSLGDMLHPPAGVYVVEGWIDGRWVPAVANIGCNPTFGENELRLEAHMLAPCGDLYQQVLRIRFWKHIRPEKRFDNADALKNRIARDVEIARAFFEGHNSGAP